MNRDFYFVAIFSHGKYLVFATIVRFSRKYCQLPVLLLCHQHYEKETDFFFRTWSFSKSWRGCGVTWHLYFTAKCFSSSQGHSECWEWPRAGGCSCASFARQESGGDDSSLLIFLWVAQACLGCSLQAGSERDRCSASYFQCNVFELPFLAMWSLKGPQKNEPMYWARSQLPPCSSALCWLHFLSYLETRSNELTWADSLLFFLPFPLWSV